MQYCASTDEENFQMVDGKTLVEALESAFADNPDHDGLWIAEAEQRTIGAYFVNAEDIVDSLTQSASEECGECTDDWLSPDMPHGITHDDRMKRIKHWRENVIGSLNDKIKATLEEWADDNGLQPTFFHAKDAKQYTREEARVMGAEAE